MEHVVFFSEDSGQSEFRRVSDLESAVRLVESLRNERGIADVTVHALTPVPVSFKTYYRVEVAISSESATAESATAELANAEPGPSDDEPASPENIFDLGVPSLADGPRRVPTLLAVPSLVEDAAPDEVFLLEPVRPSALDESPYDLAADDSGAAVAFGTLTSLNYEPADGHEPADGYKLVDEHEPVDGYELMDSHESGEGHEPVERHESVDGLQPAEDFGPVVPLNRSEPPAEHSLGYFAR